MSVDDVLRQALVNYMAQFVIPDWFQGHSEDRVWTSVYRVHNVPFNQGDRFFRRLLPIDLGLVRAVFVHMNLHYPSFRFGLNCEPSGRVTLSGGMGGWESTGEGLVLLLMTPFVGEEGEDPEASVRRRIGLARTVIVSVLGRASAWRQLTEFSFELDTGNVSAVSPVLEYPGVFDAPALDDAQAIRLVQEVIQGIASLDTATQNRVSLALRWYERALGDHRILRADDTGNVDELIDYWVALETLVGGEGKGVAGALIKLLADIHKLDTQEAGQTFPISPTYTRRKEIMHKGQMHGITKELAGFLSDVFLDLLVLRILKLAGSPRTAKYLDGAAYGFL